ncbi:hypothetical protein DPMN_109565 [Dreissena polymorpha]|uniref:Transmembrane protein n=1 Tax=Dreissena polymorpha TaxID=45954 RepID=A0A9D4KAH6_DREPO|nr:hypothetical protein DPMN_109565 [Dreissena polymorpha]
MSLVWQRNGMGPRTVSYGSSESTFTGFDFSPSKITSLLLSVRKSSSQRLMLPVTPYCSSLCRSFLFGTVSKAFLKSRIVMSICVPESQLVRRFVTIFSDIIYRVKIRRVINIRFVYVCQFSRFCISHVRMRKKIRDQNNNNKLVYCAICKGDNFRPTNMRLSLRWFQNQRVNFDQRDARDGKAKKGYYYLLAFLAVTVPSIYFAIIQPMMNPTKWR